MRRDDPRLLPKPSDTVLRCLPLPRFGARRAELLLLPVDGDYGRRLPVGVRGDGHQRRFVEAKLLAPPSAARHAGEAAALRPGWVKPSCMQSVLVQLLQLQQYLPYQSRA